MAASLATLAVLGGRSYEQRPLTDRVAQISAERPSAERVATPPGRVEAVPEQPQPTLQFASADTVDGGRVARMQWSTTRPAVQQRLNAYLVDYSEYLGTDLRGMLPYARVVGYDGRQP